VPDLAQSAHTLFKAKNVGTRLIFRGAIMAFLRRRKDGTIRIQYWDSAQGKKRDIPRSKIKHLDTLSDEDIECWIAAWEAANTIKTERVMERHR
jgi:hypothetical protein